MSSVSDFPTGVGCPGSRSMGHTPGCLFRYLVRPTLGLPIRQGRYVEGGRVFGQARAATSLALPPDVGHFLRLRARGKPVRFTV